MVAVTDMVDLTIDHGIAVLSINNPINNEIALNSLKKGCYFIEIRGEKIPPITEKLIKE